MHIIAVMYRLAVSLWLGGAALFTFVLTPILFRSYNRDMAGQIVSHLFPAYFRWGLAFGAAALVSLFLLRGKSFIPALLVLVIMLGLTSYQAFSIEPRVAALKKEIPSFETTPKEHPLRREFSRLHGYSAVCNLLVIGGGVVLVIMM
jgi:hypothetical protein